MIPVVVRASYALLVTLCFVLLAPCAVAAATIMTAASLSATPNNGAVLTLEFAQPPQFGLAGRGTNDVTLTFVDTQAPRLPVLQGAGSVQGVDFSPIGPNLIVRLHLTAPLRIGINRVGARVVVIIPAGPGAAAPAPSAPPVIAPARPPANGRVTELISLKYADVSEIVGILVAGQQIAPNDVFAPQPSSLGTPNFGSSGGIYGSAGGFSQVGTGLTAAPGQNPAAYGGNGQSVGQRITDAIAIDRRLNAIVVSGTAPEVADLRAQIAQLDVPLPSVLLETQIVELTESAAKNIGIDYTNNNVLGSAQFGIKSGGVPQGAINLQAAIYDQVLRGGGQILARPQIVAQSGSSASILTGDALPIITSITFAGSSPVVQQQVQYINIGVNLQIQPRITSDGFVTSHIYSEVSSVTGYVQSFPQISQRVATTSATVRDGEAFVIGGLIQENELNSLTKIPGFGDLPLLGGLFRHRSDQHTRTNLYIVVTPRIIGRAPANTPSEQVR
ncbi:MAG: hypothetical protein NVSMB64_14650 [Candidatus Velthaea sp.]